MGLFNPPSVKDLQKEGTFIGGLFGKVHTGQFSRADLDGLIQSRDQRERMHRAFARASADVGAEKALKALRRGANLGADAYARLGATPYGDVVIAAEDAVELMVTEGATVSRVASPHPDRDQSVEAPQFPAGFVESILQAHGYPITADNVLSMYRQIGAMTLTKAFQVFEIMGQQSMAQEFAARHRFTPTEDPARWLQRMVDDLCGLGPQVAAGMDNWPDRIRGMMARSAAKPGGFLSGDPSIPLSTFFRDRSAV
jgi:hypothetical protein